MNVLHPLHAVAAARPEETAVVSVDGELTYEGLYDRVDRYAAVLRALDLDIGERFGLVMGNSNRMLALLLAGWQIGAVPAPINIRLPPDAVAGLVEDSDAAFLLANDAVDGREEALEEVAVHRVDEDDSIFAASVPNDTDRRVTPRLDREDAVFLHTAGTTGRPKWVRLTHGNLAGSLGPMIGASLGPDDIGLHYYPLYHSGGIDMTLCRLLLGATTVIGGSWDPEDALQRIERHGADGITVVPQMGYELVHHDAVEDYDLSSLSYFLVGSDTVTEELAAEFRALGAQPMQAYGLTETMAVIAITELGDTTCPLDSTGEVIEDVANVRIVDPDTSDPVGVGEIGEILVAGDKLAAGYHERPEREAAAFEDGWLHTDDLGRFDDDGYLYITGRLDDMMVVGGENVYPTEIEEKLAHHPEIAQVVVVPVPDERKGEVPVANVVRRPGGTIDEMEVKQWFLERDAAFRHPRTIRFLERLPETALGKIDRGALATSTREALDRD